MEVGCNGMVRRLPVFAKQGPVQIGQGAWLGLHTAVVCCDVGEHGFVTSGTVLTHDLPAGMQIKPDGSTRPRYAAPPALLA